MGRKGEGSSPIRANLPKSFLSFLCSRLDLTGKGCLACGTMKEKPSHPLADASKPWGVITFIHNGKTHSFSTFVNQMTGDRMTAFDNDAPGINDAMGWIHGVFQGISAAGKVVSYKGTRHFKS